MNYLLKSLADLQRVDIESIKEPDASVIENLTEQSNRKDPVAQFSLGQILYSHGETEKAVGYFKHAAAAGHGQALYQLAVMYYDGVGVNPDPGKGFALMLQLAKSTQPDDRHLIPAAQFNLGRAFFQGIGIKKSDEEAARWWSLSTNSDKDPAAIRSMNTMALLHSRPEHLNKDRAFYWHTQAAERGHPESMAALGLFYLEGNSCKQDKEASLKWLKMSVETGSIYGTGLLTYYYYTNKMYSKAVETAKKICELEMTPMGMASSRGELLCLVTRGICTTYFIYARCMQLGQGIHKDVEKADTWYEKAKIVDKIVTAELHDELVQGKL